MLLVACLFDWPSFGLQALVGCVSHGWLFCLAQWAGRFGSYPCLFFLGYQGVEQFGWC